MQIGSLSSQMALVVLEEEHVACHQSLAPQDTFYSACQKLIFVSSIIIFMIL